MELTDIMALVKAGYTKDEIAQMEQPLQTGLTPVPETAPTQNPAPEAPAVQESVAVAVPTPTPTPTPTQTEAPAPEQPTMADIMRGIAQLTSAVQANAIAQSVIPQGLQTAPSAEDMLAEIIRPTFQKKGG